MDIREAKYMLEISKTHHLTRAANNLFITQPALTKALKKVESEFGGPIFYREGNMLQPTALGDLVLKKSANVVRELDELEHEVKNLQKTKDSTLNVGVIILSGFLYAPVLTAFKEAYPQINVVPQELFALEMEEQIRKSKLDVAFSIHMDSMSDFNEHPIFTSELAIGVDESHELAKKEYITEEDLIGQPYASYDQRTGVYQQLNERLLSKDVTPCYGLLGAEVMWLMKYAQTTNIPCILPIPSLEIYGWPTMVIRKFKPAFPWTLSLMYAKDRPQSKTSRLFIDFFLDYYYSGKYPSIFTRNGNVFDISKLVP